jgi:hypothetical protein
MNSEYKGGSGYRRTAQICSTGCYTIHIQYNQQFSLQQLNMGTRLPTETRSTSHELTADTSSVNIGVRPPRQGLGMSTALRAYTTDLGGSIPRVVLSPPQDRYSPPSVTPTPSGPPQQDDRLSPSSAMRLPTLTQRHQHLVSRLRGLISNWDAFQSEIDLTWNGAEGVDAADRLSQASAAVADELRTNALDDLYRRYNLNEEARNSVGSEDECEDGSDDGLYDDDFTFGSNGNYVPTVTSQECDADADDATVYGTRFRSLLEMLHTDARAFLLTSTSTEQLGIDVGKVESARKAAKSAWYDTCTLPK